MNTRFGSCLRAAAGTLVVLGVLSPPVAAQPPAAAKVGDGEGILLQRAGPEAPWQVLKAGAAVAPTGLVIGAGNYLDSTNGAVRLEFYTGSAWASKFPVMEAGVTLWPAGDADLAFALDRGMIHLLNQKKDGAARVKIAVPDKGFIEITLKEPETHIIIEKYGRYPAGTRFRADKPSA